MKTLETDADIAADGSIQLLTPLPAWLKPGRCHVMLAVTEEAPPADPKPVPAAPPEALKRRKNALNGLKAAGGLSGSVPDILAWQRELREDTMLPGRE